MNRSAAISKYGKKDSARPGIYIELGPEHVVIAGGAYQPEPAQLNALRNAIIENHKNFRSAIEQSEFKKYFGEIRGEKAKRISDKTQAEMALREPYLYNKQFYYWAELPPEWVTNDALIDQCIG